MRTVTAIIPTYNRAHTLRRALISVFGQTRPPDEVIVVDDGSTDSTADVLGQFPQVKVLRLRGNGGAANARNSGVRSAHCDLVAFLDSDDLWLANKLEVQLARFRATPNIGLLCSGITVVGRKGIPAYHGWRRGRCTERVSLDDLQTFPFSTSTWLIKRSVLLECGLFDESLQNSEDMDLLAKISMGHTIDLVEQPLVVKYSQLDGLNADREKAAASYELLLSRHEALWNEAPKGAARLYLRLAGMHIRAGEMGQARSALYRALRRHPWQFRPWLLIVLSVFGRKASLSLRWISRRAT